MGKFIIEYTEKAKKDFKKHKKSGDKATQKRIKRVLEELKTHPTKGIGKPEKLKHDLSGYWSRRINQKDRMIYSIDGKKILITIVSAIGHYLDK